MCVELTHLNHRLAVFAVVEADKLRVVHRHKRSLEVRLTPRGGWKDCMLDREGIAGHPTEVVSVGDDQRIERLAELTELASVFQERRELPRAAECA
jgi:hypothetical protein